MTGSPRRRAAARRALAALAVALLAASATAGGWRALPLPDRLEAAADAFVGRVVALDVEVREGEPWTVATVAVERWWRLDGRAGDSGPSEVRVAAWGGRAPGAAPLLVAGAPELVVGERVLLLLRARDGGLAVPIVGVDQGIWRARDGLWAGDDGRALGLGGDGRPALDGAAVPDALLFDALGDAFAELEPEAP